MSPTNPDSTMISNSADIISSCKPSFYPSNRVAVAMSGGIDSTIAAKILLETGFEVAGYTMRLFRDDIGGSDVTITRAAEAAKQLGIEHHIVDLTDAFDHIIANYFITEYLAGRTPNPCVMCNQQIKWQLLGKAARADGWDMFATGHYVRIAMFPDGTRTLVRGLDSGKDQSYFLWRLDTKILEWTIFPLGFIEKRDTRNRALELGLTAADHAESQEICFIPNNDFRGYLARRLSDRPPAKTMSEGDILDINGNRLGKHNGAAFYTIGQRRGLGIASHQPLYVTALDAEANTVTLGSREHLASNALSMSDIHWIRGFPPADRFRCNVRIRYRHNGIAAIVDVGKGTVVFDEPQDAVTPGQSVVLYDGDYVLGGGLIEKPL